MKRTSTLLLVFILILANSCCTINVSVNSTNPQSNQIITNDDLVDSFVSASKKLKLLPEEEFGDQRLFWINIPELVQMRATLLAVGNWSYVYMANDTIELIGEIEAIDKCEQLRDVFDDNIYPKAIEVAGSPDGNLGDIDGDPHVTLFLAPLIRNYGDNSVLGYYDNKDDDPYNPYSNMREMFYVDSERSVDDTIHTIIHELNHMIWYNYELDEAQFLTEGLANYAIDYAGYYSWVTDAVTNSFLNHPEISLLYFNREYGTLWDASYGQAYLFMTYLVDRFGHDFAKSLVSQSADGALAIDAVLTSKDYNLSFNDVYLDWITACVIDEISFADGIYGFESVNYKISTFTPIGYYFPIERSEIRHYYYGFIVNRISSPYDNFTFVIDNPYPYALGISIIVKDDIGWNVTQIHNTKKSNEISVYIKGENIQEAYVITSLMSRDTPSEYGVVMALDDVVSVDLNYAFYEGHLETKKSTFNSFVIIGSIFILGTIILLKRRKKH